MRLLARFEQGDLRLTRIEAFSDGVFVQAAFVVYLLTPLSFIVPPTRLGRES